MHIYRIDTDRLSCSVASDNCRCIYRIDSDRLSYSVAVQDDTCNNCVDAYTGLIVTGCHDLLQCKMML